MDSDLTKLSEADTVEVRRDPNFQRFAADRAISYFFGRDLELVFMIATQQLRHTETDDGEAFFPEDAGPSEVARIRISPGAATNFALDILRELAPVGGLRMEAFEPALTEILETAREAATQRAPK